MRRILISDDAVGLSVGEPLPLRTSPAAAVAASASAAAAASASAPPRDCSRSLRRAPLAQSTPPRGGRRADATTTGA